MIINRYDTGLLHSNMYVISDNGHVIVIDPCENINPVVGNRVDWILLTHEHYDHISGVNKWKNSTSGRVLCSAACADRIGDPKRNLARLFPEFCQMQTWITIDKVPNTDINYRCYADDTFIDEAVFFWQGHKFRLQEIPGHSPGSIGIYVDQSYFFSGDSLLNGKEIELRFPGGSRQQWEAKGLQRIEAIPKGIIVYPGHFDSFIRS